MLLAEVDVSNEEQGALWSIACIACIGHFHLLVWVGMAIELVRFLVRESVCTRIVVCENISENIANLISWSWILDFLRKRVQLSGACWCTHIGPHDSRSCFLWRFERHYSFFVFIRLFPLQICSRGISELTGSFRALRSAKTSTTLGLVVQPTSLITRPSFEYKRSDVWCCSNSVLNTRKVTFREIPRKVARTVTTTFWVVAGGEPS